MMSILRFAVGLAGIAAAFGAAALWQTRELSRMRDDRMNAALVANGSAWSSDGALLPAGTAVVWVGRPARTEDPEAPRAQERQQPAPADAAEPSTPAPPPSPPPTQPDPPAAKPEQPLGDFQLEVQAGQTLFGIVRTHYGRADLDLVDRLARYNGLADRNALSAGQRLKLPTIEKLVPAR
jgi:nucleoid-associated protein YgaU